jgi:hypothetical protein
MRITGIGHDRVMVPRPSARHFLDGAVYPQGFRPRFSSLAQMSGSLAPHASTPLALPLDKPSYGECGEPATRLPEELKVERGQVGKARPTEDKCHGSV